MTQVAVKKPEYPIMCWTPPWEWMNLKKLDVKKLAFYAVVIIIGTKVQIDGKAL